MSQNSTWDEVLKKEAKCMDENCDLGEVQKIEADVIVTQKGFINKEKYSIPKTLIAGFDGSTLYFGIRKDETKRFRLMT